MFRGAGFAPGETVVFTLAGQEVGTEVADDQGRVEVHLDLSDADVGRQQVTARSASITLVAPVDVVLTTAAQTAGPGTVGVVLCFFVLLGLLVLQPLRGNTDEPERRRK